MTLNLAQTQITKAIDTVTELERAILSFSDGKIVEAKRALDRLFITEKEIDDLRGAIFGELTKGTLPIKYREDLKSLVQRLDRLADHVKDAARSIKILVETESAIPQEFLDIFVRMIKTLVECTGFLSKSIEVLGIDPQKAIEYSRKVDESEGHIDDAHLRAKMTFIKNSKAVSPPVFLVLKDLADSIEHAADYSADTADFIRVLAVSED
jgi:predicted phosphate transport protein (TIGR00153 family)